MKTTVCRMFQLLGSLTVIMSILFALACGSEKPESAESAPKPPPASTPQKITIGLMPKLMGIDFFNSLEIGAMEAARELGVDVIYDGPVISDVTKQAAMVETWIARGFDAICISPNDPDAIAPVLKKARARGIKVITFDADSNPEARDFFVNQCTYEAVAKALVETMVKGIGPEGKYIYLTGSLTAFNQNMWMDRMEKYRAEKYPNMVNLSEVPKASEEDQALATQVTIDMLKAYPDLDGIYGMTSLALPGAAEALIKENAYDRIFLTGLSTPNSMREFVKQGVVREFVLWSPVDLGYLAIYASKAVADGSVDNATASIQVGRLGEIEIRNREFLLGDPMIFDAENVDQFNF